MLQYVNMKEVVSPLSKPNDTIALVHGHALETGLALQTGVVQPWMQLHDESGLGLEQIDYTIAPKPQTALITPYVNLNPSSGTITNENRIYVVSKALTDVRGQKITREASSALTELHVIAEDRALTRGIFTHRARALVEAEVAGIVPNHFLLDYVTKRIGHLEWMHRSMEDLLPHESRAVQKGVMEENLLAVGALKVLSDARLKK